MSMLDNIKAEMATAGITLSEGTDLLPADWQKIKDFMFFKGMDPAAAMYHIFFEDASGIPATTEPEVTPDADQTQEEVTEEVVEVVPEVPSTEPEVVPEVPLEITDPAPEETPVDPPVSVEPDPVV